MSKKKVVIIGAGPAGITAAKLLVDSFDVVILEADRCIGGISRTVACENGLRMDIGGHRFFSKNEEVKRFWLENMPLQGAHSADDLILGRENDLCEGGPDPEKADTVMLTRSRISRILFGGKFFDYPLSLSFQTLRDMGIIRSLRAGMGFLWASVFKKKEDSLENFYINRFGKPLYTTFFENYTEKVWGRHPSQISADWGAQRVKGLSLRSLISNMFMRVFGKNSDTQIETSLIERFWYPKMGPGQFWETVAEKAVGAGAVLHFGYKAKRFTCDEAGNLTAVICETEQGEISVEGDIFISSMPLDMLTAGLPDLPQKIAEIASGLVYRDFMTAGLLVDELKIKNKTDRKTLGDIVPDCWIYVQQPEVKMGRIQIFNNWSPYLLPNAEHQVWLGLEYFTNEGDMLSSMKDDDFIAFAESELIKLGIISEGAVKFSCCKRMSKAYPAYFGSYDRIRELRDYLLSIPNLWCVGRNGQHRYNNMDHSMLTAMKTAACIKKEDFFNKAAIWDVNAEKEYHEKK